MKRYKAWYLWVPNLLFGSVVVGGFALFWFVTYSISQLLFAGLSALFVYRYLVEQNIISSAVKKDIAQGKLVVVVGAGFSGICSGVKLKEAGIPFVILEKSGEIGGTWWDNKYPGCACDVMAHLYSFSFYSNPNWSRTFQTRVEIFQYLRDVCSHYGLNEHMKLNCKVESCRFDKTTNRWTVATSEGEEIVCDFIISGAGALHVPKFPEIPGQETFTGKSMHTALWDESYDYRKKKVAVIGTGCSAIQVVPSIAPDVDRLYVFQRTPSWVIPRLDFRYPWLLQKLFQFVPITMTLHRWYLFYFLELFFHIAFTKGAKHLYIVRNELTSFLKDSVQSSDLVQKLMPTYGVGCKRITFSNDYLTSFNRENVTLITDRIDSITENGVRTNSSDSAKPTQDIEVDAIIYATGFDVLRSASNVPVCRENDGVRITEIWKDQPSAYLGITYPGFPNIFLLMGPNTLLGHSSVVWMMECQVNYSIQAIKETLKRGATTMEVKEDALRKYMDYVKEEIKFRVFSGSGCVSWYSNKSGYNFTLWPSNCMRYWWETVSVKFGDYIFR